MYRMKWLFPLAAFLLQCSAPYTAHAQQQNTAADSTSTAVPRLIKFDGTLLNEQGHLMKGPVGVTFALYAQQSGGAALWMETQNVELDTSGNYSVLLGAASASGVPMDLFASSEARWLGVQAERQPEQPRTLLVSVPYALKAGDAQTLGGLPATAYALAGSQPASSAPAVSSMTNLIATAQPATPNTATTTGSGTADFLPLWTNSTTLGNSILFQAPSSNSIGIGITAPTAKLDVNGGATIRGQLSLPFTGTATSTIAFNSQPLDLLASAFNSSTHAAVPQHFRWEAEPTGNNSASPSGKLNLLFASGTGTPSETGLSISNTGIITFAPGQTMPTVTGNETVTGNFSAGSVSAGSAVFSGNSSSQIASITQTSAAGNGLMATVKGGFGVNATATSPGAVGVAGNASSTTGAGVGVIGSAQSPSGIGVLGTAPNGGIGVKGVSSVVGSSVGVAGEFNSTNGAVILRGLNGSTTEFNVTGGGAVFANGSVSANGTVFANGGFSGSAIDIGGNAVLGGPVGIGTTFAHAQLDVHDFASESAIDTLIGNPGCGTSFAGIGFLPGGTGFGACTNYSLLGDGTNTFVNAGPLGALHFRLSNGDAMIVNNNARVGIGTTTPVAKLDVNGDANISGVLITGNLATQVSTSTPTASPGGAFSCNTGNPTPNANCVDLSLSFTNQVSPVLIMANLNGISNIQCVVERFLVVVDGNVVGKSTVFGDGSVNDQVFATSVSIMALSTLSPGSHNVSLQEFVDGSRCSSLRFLFTSGISNDNDSSTIIVREW